ncbi:MAG: preprotein translocase subunit SecG [Chloroflexota bacterium]|nr:preprotein translocase subunit SecG [Chloroflexota bacterium]
MITYLYIVQIILSCALIAVILLQAKGAGLGGIFGGDTGSVYKTRRGVEKTLFNLTIGLSIVFFLTSFITVLLSPAT